MRLAALFVFFTLVGLLGAKAEEPAFLGIRVGDLSQEEAQKLGWPAPHGAKVFGVIPGGPAAAAGLDRGDVILTLDDVEIANYRHFLAIVQMRAPGAQLRVKFLRNGKEIAANVKMGSAADALADLDRVIAGDPKNFDAHRARANILFRLKRGAEAAPDCDALLNISPENGWGLYCKAMVSIALGKREAALADLNVAVTKLTRSEQPLLARAALYAEAKDYERAIADLNRALAIDERNAEALAMRGVAYLAKAMIERAIEDFNAALAIDSQNARAKRGLDATLAKRREVAAPRTAAIPDGPPAAPAAPHAETPAQKQQEPVEVDAKLKAEVFQLRAKRQYKQAVELIDKALAANPNHAGLHNLRGETLHYSGDLAGAIAEYDKAVLLQPQFNTAHINRINARLAARKTDEALKAAEEFLGLNQNLSTAYYLRGKVYMQANRLDEALSDFDKAIEKDPKPALNWIGRGQLHLARKDYDKALADLTKAIEADPKSDNAYSLRGKVHLLQKNIASAVADFRKSLSINGANWVAFTSLQGLQMAKALEQLGQIKKGGT